MDAKWKTVLVTAAKFLIPALVIAYLVGQMGQEQWDELSHQPKNYLFLGLALAVALIAMSLSFTRWCLLVRCQGIELSMREAFRLGAIGYLLSFVSVGSVGGDLFKAVFLARRRPGKRIEAVASVVVDRGVGLYGLLLLVSVALWWTDPPDAGSDVVRISHIKTGAAVMVGLGTVVLAILVLGGRGVDRWVIRGSSSPLFGPLIARVGPPLRMFHSHPVAFAVSVAMSVGVQSLFAVSLYLIARGLYAAPPTLGEHFVIVPVGMVASALPLTPGGMGVFEVTIDTLYKIVPATPTAASGTMVALVFEAVKITMAVIGTIYYWTANAEVRESLELADEQSHSA